MVSVARVRIAATPQTAPAELDDFVTPQFENGRVADWTINYRRILTSPDMVAITEKVGEWRQGWAWEHLLGRKDSLAGMVDAYVGVGGEPPIILAGAGEQLVEGNRVVIDDIDGLRTEVEALRSAFVASGKRGWALFTPEKRGTVWAAAWQDEVEIVAEAGSSQVLCRPEGFFYRHAGREFPLIGWRRRGGQLRMAVGERATLDTESGQGAEWMVAGPELASALGLAVEGADPIRSIKLPLSALYAKAIVGLTEAAQMAEAHGTVVTVYPASSRDLRPVVSSG